MATDNDPSGDFIAWSVADDLQLENLCRSNLQVLSKSALSDLIKNAALTDSSRLRKRLENRYLIRRMWKHQFPEIDIRSAAAASIFGAPGKFSHFKCGKGNIYSSLQPVNCDFNSQIHATHVNSRQQFQITKPLSTFKVLELSAKSAGFSLVKALENLYRLFETPHPFSDEGLITYPRTGARSFFEGSWQTIRQQWIQQHSLNDFIPESLQKITPGSCAHDSIRPADLNADPGYISKHIPADTGALYSLIHRHTLKAISMPQPVSSMYQSKESGALFMSNCGVMDESIQLRPCLTLSDFGTKMADLGVIRPSGFAAYVEKARHDGFITLTPTFEVNPGGNLAAYEDKAKQFGYILTQLKECADDPKLQPETISAILTS
jgi:hypothetical protein